MRVAAELAPRLVKLAQLHGLGQKELLAEMVGYFERTQADPHTGGKGESLPEKMDKVSKRLETVISFFKEQEKAILKPLCAQVRVISAAQQASETHQVEEFARVRRVVVRVIKEGLKPDLLNLDSAPFRNSGQ